MHVRIRQYRTSDTNAVLEAVLESKRELTPWMQWCHANYGRSDAETWVNSRPEAWQQNQQWSFVIVDQHDRLLGTCGFHQLDLLNGNAELGYWVRTRFTGQGVATKTIQLACDWAFRERGLHRVEILTAIENRASQHAAEKAGAVREAILRQRLRLGTQWHDAVLFTVLNEDHSS